MRVLWNALRNIPLFGDWGSILGTLVLLYSLFKFITDRYQRRRLKEFWNPLGHNWTIIKPKYYNSMAREEDILATNEIKAILDNCKYEYQDKFDDIDLSYGNNNIIICGPGANLASKKISEKYKITFEIAFDNKISKSVNSSIPPYNGRKTTAFIKDHVTGNSIYSPMDIGDGEQKSDVGIIGRIRTNDNKSSQIFLWGLHGVGTYGCAKYIASKEFINKHYSTLRGKDFIFLIRVDFKNVSDITNIIVVTSIYTNSDVFMRER